MQLARAGTHQDTHRKTLGKRIRKYTALYILCIPILAYFCIFRFYPLVLQFVVSFTDYKLIKGVWGSPWVGWKNFEHLIAIPGFSSVLVNTVSISLLRLLFGFLPPMVLAIFLFDLQSVKLRRVSQTLVYIPHFFSWVIIYGMVFACFSNSGLLNSLTKLLTGRTSDYLMSSAWARPILIGSAIWKEMGWGTILYLAGLSNVDPNLYEAAKIDGAGPVARIVHITLPSLARVIVFLLTLSFGGILYAGGEQILLYYSPATYDVLDVIDTWVYRRGFSEMQYSYATAVSFFQSLMGLCMVLIANKLANRFAGTGIW